MDVAREVTELWKIGLASVAVVLVVAWPRIAVRRRTVALWLLVGISALNYARFGLETVFERIDAYDLVHYYVNAKYFDELGYYDLLPCVILADHENDGPRWDQGDEYLAQHLGGHVRNPIEHALARGRHVRATRFDPETWAAFEHDVLYLTRDQWRGGSKLYRQMIRDHGYNGTLAWTVLAAPIARAVPVEQLKWLGFLDFFLLVGAIALVGWAWDRDAAGWVALFLLVSYSTRWPTITWAFLRYDYVVGLVAATALLKRGRPVLAGLLGGWAAAARLFPALWLWGPVFKAGWELRSRNRPRALLWFLGAFAVSAVGLTGIAAARYGPEHVGIHIENMKDHNDPEKLSSRRIGLALALTHNGRTTPTLLTAERRRTMEAQRPWRLALAGGILVALGWGLRRRGDEEVFGYGFLPFFLLTTASYYYYVARATLVAVHAGDLSSARNRAGLAWLLGLEAFCNAAESALPEHRMFLVGYLAWGLLVYAVVSAGWLVWEAGDRAEER